MAPAAPWARLSCFCRGCMVPVARLHYYYYFYYYIYERRARLVSKVNTGGILAEGRCSSKLGLLSQNSWPLPLAACQSWYLCLVVITPARADLYLAACLQLPSHSQEEIIKAGMLLRESCRCCCCCLENLERFLSPSIEALCPQH